MSSNDLTGNAKTDFTNKKVLFNALQRQHDAKMAEKARESAPEADFTENAQKSVRREVGYLMHLIQTKQPDFSVSKRKARLEGMRDLLTTAGMMDRTTKTYVRDALFFADRYLGNM